MNVWNTCPIYGCIFPNTFFYKFSMRSNLNVRPEDTLILPRVKKNSAETHVSSTFITKQMIGYEKKLEDWEQSVTVLFSSVYHVPFCFDIVFVGFLFSLLFGWLVCFVPSASVWC